jgi:hypothetical protein
LVVLIQGVDAAAAAERFARFFHSMERRVRRWAEMNEGQTVLRARDEVDVVSGDGLRDEQSG